MSRTLGVQSPIENYYCWKPILSFFDLPLNSDYALRQNKSLFLHRKYCRPFAVQDAQALFDFIFKNIGILLF